MKRYAFLVLLLLAMTVCLGTTALAQPVSSGVVNVSALNVRSGPGVGFDRVDVIFKGTKVDIYQQNNGWLKIDNGNKWVSAQFVDISSSLNEPVQNLKDSGVVNTAIANIRQGPSTSFPILGTLRKGMTIEILKEENGWYNFQYIGKKGWIAAFLVDTNSPKEPPPSEEQAFERYRVIISENVVNVRSGPGTQHSIVGKTNAGTEFEVIGSSSGWLQITNAQQSGYVADWLVQKKTETVINNPNNTINNGSQNFERYQIIISESVVNVRSGPGTQHSIVGKTYAGIEFEVIGANNGWLQVRNQEQSGYIADWLAIRKNNIQDTRPENGETINGEPRRKIVVIDPGHGTIRPGGWADPGAISPLMRIRELDVVLDLSRRLEIHLKNKGYDVHMTHRGTTHRDLYGRSDFANDLNADVFVSIHANASSNRLAQGIGLFYFAPDWMPGLLNQKAQRLQLSQMILSEARATTNRPAYGIFEKNFVVLRETTMPSVLVETGFLTNQTEERLLIDPVFQEQMALGIANGIEKYLER